MKTAQLQARTPHWCKRTEITLRRKHVQLQAPCASATPPEAAPAEQPAVIAYQELCGFIKSEGGFVHPALQLNLNSGTICATQDIPQPKGSLVELPLSIRLTTAVAQELLLPVLNAAGMPTMSLLEESQQLALAVAWLRNQGTEADPKWQPYLQTLPQQNPCGWAKTQQQLSQDYESYLHLHGLDESWWRYFVAQVQQQMLEQAAGLASRYGKALGVTADDILWALGHVQARKVVIDNEVLLEPWSDMLRHPPASSSSSSSSSSCEINWSYGLCRSGTSVLSRGCGRRVSGKSAVISSSGGSSSEHAAGPAGAAADQDGPPLLLSAGEELWASSSSSSSGSATSGAGSAGDLWSVFISEHGHLAPLAWYLQHGYVAQGLASVSMRTSDILDSWRLTLESEAAQSSSSPSTAAERCSTADGSRNPTVLWDYLTQDYQQDALTVLAATPAEHQQQLLQWLMKPVTARAAEADVDPLPMISVLDELLIAAIDAAEEE